MIRDPASALISSRALTDGTPEPEFLLDERLRAPAALFTSAPCFFQTHAARMARVRQLELTPLVW